MGGFLFKWEQPATEVYVTGTFDDWAKSVRLEKKKENLFEKFVQLPQTKEDVYYKFVVDNEWTIDTNAPQERDGSSNINNVLTPQHIASSSSETATPSIMSEANSQTTAAGSAGGVPKDAPSGQAPKSDRSVFPGAFPETPANETTEFSVNPIPATSGTGNPINLAPGEKVPDPSTLTSNTISSTARDDTSLAKKANDSEQTIGVSPLPATSGIGNPVQLEAGEKVPPSSSFTQNTLNTFVTTDKESYERGSGPPQLPNVVTPQKERDNRGTSLFNLPPVSGAMIPESSLPIFGASNEEQDPGFTIQSVGPNSTTAALAGQVPLEPRGVPTVIPQDEGSSKQERDSVLRDPTSGPNQSTAASAGAVPSASRADETPSKGQDPDVFIQSVGPSSSTAKLAGGVPLEPRSSLRDLPESRSGDGPLGVNRSDNVTVQSVGPESTTAGLAGNVPLESQSSPKAVPENQQHEKEQEKSGPSDVTIQSVGPESTTAGLAGKVPLEPKSSTSGGFENQKRPEGQKGDRSDDVTIQSVGPDATTAGLVGNVPLESREPSRGTSGIPQHLDEKEGSKLGDATIQSVGANATTAALAGKVPLESSSPSKGVSENQQQPDERERGRPDDVTIQSVGPNATTAGLAGNVPLEPRGSPGNPPEGRRTGDDTQGGGPANAFIQSTGANATTAGLAGKVPLEPRSSPENPSEGNRIGDDTQGGEPGNAFIQSTGANATTAGLAGKVPLEPRSSPKNPSDGNRIGDDTQGGGPGNAFIQSTGANATTAGLAGKVPLEPRSSPENPSEGNRIGDDTQGDGPGNAFIQSTGANATTAGLAGNVPLEPQGVPEIVQESQQTAGFAPEASANAEALREKAALEEELESVVPKEPPTSEGIGGATAGRTPLGDTTNIGSTSRGLHPSVLQSIDEINRGSTKGPTTSDTVASGSVGGSSQGIAIAPTVPDVVQESIAKSNQSPEAAASATVVDEKKAVESELLKVVKPEEALGEPAPSASAALSEKAPAPTSSANIGQVGNTGVAAADPKSGVPAKSATEKVIQNRHDSRDISPMSHPVEGLQTGSQPIPQLTSGAVPEAARPTTTPGGTSSSVSAGLTPSSTPQKSRAEPVRGSSGTHSPQATSEASASSDRKSKRASGFFGKLKSKFSHKD